MLPQIRREPSLLLRRALEEGQKENLGVADSENESLRRTLGHRSASCSASPSGFGCDYTMDYKLCVTFLGESPRLLLFSQLEKSRFYAPPEKTGAFFGRGILNPRRTLSRKGA